MAPATATVLLDQGPLAESACATVGSCCKTLALVLAPLDTLEWIVNAEPAFLLALLALVRSTSAQPARPDTLSSKPLEDASPASLAPKEGTDPCSATADSSAQLAATTMTWLASLADALSGSPLAKKTESASNRQSTQVAPSLTTCKDPGVSSVATQDSILMPRPVSARLAPPTAILATTVRLVLPATKASVFPAAFVLPQLPAQQDWSSTMETVLPAALMATVIAMVTA